MTAAVRVATDPARAAGSMMVSAVLSGGEIVLAGGSTPKAAYAEFVRQAREVGLDLSGTRFWIGDERCVGPDDERSNYKMIQESLLAPLAAVAQPAVERIRGELGPFDGADDYERRLREAGPPEFDLVLLGLGPDGHTASLFPEQPTLTERSRLVVAVPEAGLAPFVPRITMTFPALAAAREVVLLTEGSSKAQAVAAALHPPSGRDPRTPGSLLVAEVRRLVVLLDQAAAAGISAGAQ